MADDTSIMSEPSNNSPPPPAEDNSSMTAALNRLTEEVSQLRQEIKGKDDMISELQGHIHYLETEIPIHNKKRKLSNSVQVADEDEGMKNLRIENEKLRQQIDELRDLKAVTADTTSNQIQTTQENPSNTTTNNLTDMMKMIEEKLSSGFSKIKEDMNELVEHKLDKLPNVTNDAVPTGSSLSYASAVGKNHVSGNLKSIMMTTKNEEITEQNEKKRRAKNIMIFGKSEYGERWQKDEDKAFAEKLFKDLQIGQIEVKEVSRIGEYNREGTKIRPLKITVDTEEQKEKIMRNLSNLKGNDDYGGISIKEDYTINERMLIREYVEQAKALNALETTKRSKFEYRVRGTPKNGLFLKKFMSKRETTQVPNQ